MSMDDQNTEKPKVRTVFFVSDATAITAETLANSVLAQFHGLNYVRWRMPFINTIEKAKAAALKINEIGKETGSRRLCSPLWLQELLLPPLMNIATLSLSNFSGHSSAARKGTRRPE